MDPKDGGWASRKVILTMAAMGMMLVTGLIGAWWPAFRETMEPTQNGILMALGAYLGVNVVNRIGTAKTIGTMSPSSTPSSTPAPTPGKPTPSKKLPPPLPPRKDDEPIESIGE